MSRVSPSPRQFHQECKRLAGPWLVWDLVATLESSQPQRGCMMCRAEHCCQPGVQGALVMGGEGAFSEARWGGRR
jgi:hypothetical protein